MKIGIESQRIFRSHKHGMDVVAVEIIRQLQQIDHSNEFLVFAKEGSDKDCINETKNFHVKILKGYTYGDWEQVSLPLALKKMKPDLIHCTGNTAPVICPVPLVLTLHDIIYLRETNFKGTAYQNFGNLYRRVVVPHAIKKAKVITTVSEQEKIIIVEACNVDPSQIVVIHNAVDDRFRKQYAAEEVEAFRHKYRLPLQFILHLGNTAPKKNTEQMIQAYVEYVSNVKDALPLVLADFGKQAVEKKLEELNRTELMGYFYFPGYIPSAEMPLLYNCASLFVYPSLMESFGLPVLEAMACGKPVITSEIAALREVAGDAAVFIDPESSRSIAEAMADLIGNSEKYVRFQEKGRERALYFSWRRSAEKLLKVYSSL